MQHSKCVVNQKISIPPPQKVFCYVFKKCCILSFLMLIILPMAMPVTVPAPAPAPVIMTSGFLFHFTAS